MPPAPPLVVLLLALPAHSCVLLNSPLPLPVLVHSQMFLMPLLVSHLPSLYVTFSVPLLPPPAPLVVLLMCWSFHRTAMSCRLPRRPPRQYPALLVLWLLLLLLLSLHLLMPLPALRVVKRLHHFPTVSLPAAMQLVRVLQEPHCLWLPMAVE